MYKLYTFAQSSTAWRVRIALNLKQITPEYINVHLLKGEQRTESYAKLNPNKGVPTLVLPDGTSLFQSMAIIEYINQAHPYPHNLFAGTPKQRAQIRAFCEVVNSGVHPYQNLKLLDYLETNHKVDRWNWCLHWVLKSAEMMEKVMEQYSNGGPFVMGNQLTCADLFFYPQILNTKNRWKIDLSHLPNTSRVLANLQTIKEFRDAEPQNQKDFEPIVIGPK